MFKSYEKKKKVDGVGNEVQRKAVKRGLGCSWSYSDYERCSRIRLQSVKGEHLRANWRDPKWPIRS